jgi:N-acetylmuramoyl-L-alanine amidase
MEAFDQDDLQNAILCVWKEARGDGYEAMDAVAHVIFNRVGAPGFPNSLHDVIYGKNQFSSMSISTDPNTTFRHRRYRS